MSQSHRFPVLVWRDKAGFFTGSLIDAEGVATYAETPVAYGPSARDVLQQMKEYLKWYYKTHEWAEAPGVEESRLVYYKVPIRPEYRIQDKVFPYDRRLSLKLEVVDCSHGGGMRSAVIPRLNVEFFYTQGQLRELVRHYVQEKLSGQPPRVLGRFSPPEEVVLESVHIKLEKKKTSGEPAPYIKSLSSVAQAMGTKLYRSRYNAPYGREKLVQELQKRMGQAGSNILLVGEKGCGKTSLLIEVVRKLERAAKDKRLKRRYWMSRGARIIAGMKYLGQWEERLEMVIEELQNIEGVLCFETLQELITTGGRGAEDSVAAFLMPYMEQGEITIITEASSRELDSCRRLLPGFVDMFSIVNLPEFDATESQAVLDKVEEKLTKKYRIEADPNLVSECYRLHKRFLPYHAFPGRAASFMAQVFDLAKREQLELDRTLVVERFSQQTGLPLNLLKDEEAMPAEKVLQFFQSRVVGQPNACEAVTSKVCTFKAGLNDPERPLGVLLFCGPTGVGKTELAKAVSECFFGANKTEDRLLRLDMSEYGGPGATHRLLGNRERPGELIRRVRQQPFTVILLDEIEKAHPDIFDLLLGVFDEGRLTDPWGRVTTFRSSVIILTSNLGVSALRPLGLNQNKKPSFQKEVMDFFRPEFFNRIDSVVSFDPLSKESIATITEMELNSLTKREGLKKREIKLRWTTEVTGYLAEKGYDARYGARPLKRTVEQEIVVPLARYLVDNPDLSDCFVDIEMHKGKILLG